MSKFKFNSLKIISLNVRGLQDNTKRKAIFLFIRKTDASVILLQETHSSDTDSKFWKSQWGDQAYFAHASHRSVGVTLLFNKFTGDTLEKFISEEGRWIIIVVKLDYVYGHNERNFKNNQKQSNSIYLTSSRLGHR